jgi:hypothetical protein
MNSSNFNNHIRKIGKIIRYTTLYDIIILRNIWNWKAIFLSENEQLLVFNSGTEGYQKSKAYLKSMYRIKKNGLGCNTFDTHLFRAMYHCAFEYQNLMKSKQHCN